MKDSKNVVIALLCTILCVMAVAYAAFSTTLTINGTASISSTWDVAIEDIVCDVEEGLDGAAEIVPTIPNKKGTTATIGVTLNQPGDKMTCVVTIKNNGDLEAKLASITTTPDNIENTENGGTSVTDFVHFTLGKGTGDVTELATLGANDTHKYTIEAEYMLLETANGTTILPGEGVETSREVTVSFNYVQNLPANNQ